MRSVKTILALVAGVCLAVALLWATLLGGYSRILGSTSELAKAESFSGTVLSINDGGSCFKALAIVTDKDTVIESVCDCDFNHDFLSYVQVTDIVSKMKDSLVVAVTRSATHETTRFIYPVCDH